MQCVHVPIPLKKIPGDFIEGREALVRLVRIKARFMRQREKRFAQYHKTSLFIKQGGVCLVSLNWPPRRGVLYPWNVLIEEPARLFAQVPSNVRLGFCFDGQNTECFLSYGAKYSISYYCYSLG